MRVSWRYAATEICSHPFGKLRAAKTLRHEVTRSDCIMEGEAVLSRAGSIPVGYDQLLKELRL